MKQQEGGGRRRSPGQKSKTPEETNRKKGDKISSTASPLQKPPPSPKPPKRIKPTNPPAEIYGRVKKEAVNREFDHMPEERAELAQKTRMLRRWIRITDDLSMTVDPAYSTKTDLPKISSQVAYAAVYDWMVIAKFKNLISPFDSAYKTIWQEKNSEQEKIKFHKQVEEIDIKVNRKK